MRWSVPVVAGLVLFNLAIGSVILRRLFGEHDLPRGTLAAAHAEESAVLQEQHVHIEMPSADLALDDAARPSELGSWRALLSDVPADEQGAPTLVAGATQAPTPTPTPEPVAAGAPLPVAADAGTLAGTVRDLKTGQPLADAEVRMITGTGNRVARTDASGRYVLEGVAPGRRSVEARSEGYTTRGRGAIDVAAGQIANVDLELSPGSETRHEFGGIGASLRAVRDAVRVTHIVPDSPAASAGLQAGDVLVAVDGQTVGDNLERTLEAIRGDEGTRVLLEIERAGKRETLGITRAKVFVGEGE